MPRVQVGVRDPELRKIHGSAAYSSRLPRSGTGQVEQGILKHKRKTRNVLHSFDYVLVFLVYAPGCLKAVEDLRRNHTRN